MSGLHDRVAKALGWSVRDTQGFSLPTGFKRKTLREVVALLPELRERMTVDLSSQDAALKAKVKALVGKGK
jgi:hypothetical protein